MPEIAITSPEYDGDQTENHIELVQKALNSLRNAVEILVDRMDELNGRNREKPNKKEKNKVTHFQSLWASLPIELASCSSSINKVCRDLVMLIHSPRKTAGKLPDPEASSLTGQGKEMTF